MMRLIRLFDLDPRSLVPQVNQVDSYHNCYRTHPFPRLAASGGETGKGRGVVKIVCGSYQPDSPMRQAHWGLSHELKQSN